MKALSEMMMPIGKKHNLTQRIQERLGAEIVSGHYTNLVHFPVEAELCERFDASRSVMREAIKMLTAKGLLASRPKQGTRVLPESAWNLLDPDVLNWLLTREISTELLIEFTEIRMAIEPLAVRLAIKRADENAHKLMLSAIDAMEAAARGVGDPVQTDIDLHLSILRASGNRFLIQHKDLIQTALKFSIRLSNQVKKVRIASVSDHRVIIEAIIAKDEKRGVDATMKLLDDTMAYIVREKAAGIC